jgi:hypothetical protein
MRHLARSRHEREAWDGPDGGSRRRPLRVGSVGPRLRSVGTGSGLAFRTVEHYSDVLRRVLLGYCEREGVESRGSWLTWVLGRMDPSKVMWRATVAADRDAALAQL